MLNLFSRTASDHPFADLRAARLFLRNVGGTEASRAIEDCVHWLRSVSAEDAFKPAHRAQALLMIDEAAQPHVRRVTQDYLASNRQQKKQEARIWLLLYDYLQTAAEALMNAMPALARGRVNEATQTLLARLAVCTMRTLAVQLKWMHLRYGPVEPQLWAGVARVYALAESARVSQTMVVVHPGLPGQSSMQCELLRLLMFAACSPGNLVPSEMELYERLIAHFASAFEAAPEWSPTTPYWVDLGAPASPRRGPVPSDAVGPVGFFGAGAAYEGLLSFAEQLRASAKVPSAFDLDESWDIERVLAITEHLEQHWSPALPERRFARRPSTQRLTVTRGFDGVLDALQLLRDHTFTFVSPEIESWVTEDVSASGFGALVPALTQEWLHIGCLLGLQSEGESQWSVGVVRRLTRLAGQHANVGIQVLSRTAVPVEVQIQSEFNTGPTSERAVLLPPLRADEELRLLLPAGVYTSGQLFRIEGAKGERLLVPLHVAERGEDYELLVCCESSRTMDRMPAH